MNAKQESDYEILIRLKDEEITRQIASRKLAEQTRNWTIIIVVVFYLLIWLI